MPQACSLVRAAFPLLPLEENLLNDMSLRESLVKQVVACEA